MALIKHEIPILEYDDSQEAVIMPGRHPMWSVPPGPLTDFSGRLPRR